MRANLLARDDDDDDDDVVAKRPDAGEARDAAVL